MSFALKKFRSQKVQKIFIFEIFVRLKLIDLIEFLKKIGERNKDKKLVLSSFSYFLSHLFLSRLARAGYLGDCCQWNALNNVVNTIRELALARDESWLNNWHPKSSGKLVSPTPNKAFLISTVSGMQEHLVTSFNVTSSDNLQCYISRHCTGQRSYFLYEEASFGLWVYLSTWLWLIPVWSV